MVAKNIDSMSGITETTEAFPYDVELTSGVQGDSRTTGQVGTVNDVSKGLVKQLSWRRSKSERVNDGGDQGIIIISGSASPATA